MVEGYDDREFISHLKRLYCRKQGGIKITIANAKGKGAGNVIDTAFGRWRQGGFDDLVVFYDGDLPPTGRARNRARSMKRLVAEPCLEGLFLEILGRPVPVSCRECKGAFRDLVGDRTFEQVFPRELLDERSEQVRLLKDLIDLSDGLMRRCPGGCR